LEDTGIKNFSKPHVFQGIRSLKSYAKRRVQSIKKNLVQQICRTRNVMYFDSITARITAAKDAVQYKGLTYDLNRNMLLLISGFQDDLEKKCYPV
jgi:outer membrane receptor for ferric coprogen and ferric-rhodotorulic acid